MRLELSLAAFEGVYRRLDRTRRNSATVTVDKEALATLLRDHQRILERLADLGERPISPGE
jgi:hypothetical protein